MKESEVEIINEGGFSILTEEEMKELVYENGSTPNPYFLTEQDGGAFHYSVFEELKFTLAKKTKKYFIVTKKDNKLLVSLLLNKVLERQMLAGIGLNL